MISRWQEAPVRHLALNGVLLPLNSRQTHLIKIKSPVHRETFHFLKIVKSKQKRIACCDGLCSDGPMKRAGGGFVPTPIIEKDHLHRCQGYHAREKWGGLLKSSHRRSFPPLLGSLNRRPV